MVQSIAAERVLCTNWRETPLRPPVTDEHAGQKPSPVTALHSLDAPFATGQGVPPPSATALIV